MIKPGRRKAPPTVDEVLACEWWWCIPPEGDDYLPLAFPLVVVRSTDRIYHADSRSDWYEGDPFEPADFGDGIEWAPCIMPGPAEGES